MLQKRQYLRSIIEAKLNEIVKFRLGKLRFRAGIFYANTKVYKIEQENL